MWPNFYIFLQAGVMDFSFFFRRFVAWKPLHGSESISSFGSKTELESTFASGSPKPSSLVDCFDCGTAAGRLCCRHCSQRPGQTRDFQIDPKPLPEPKAPKLFLWRIKQRRKINIPIDKCLEIIKQVDVWEIQHTFSKIDSVNKGRRTHVPIEVFVAIMIMPEEDAPQHQQRHIHGKFDIDSPGQLPGPLQCQTTHPQHDGV